MKEVNMIFFMITVTHLTHQIVISQDNLSGIFIVLDGRNRYPPFIQTTSYHKTVFLKFKGSFRRTQLLPNKFHITRQLFRNLTGFRWTQFITCQ